MGLKAEEEGLALETYSQPVKFQSLEKKPLPGETPAPPSPAFPAWLLHCPSLSTALYP